MCTALAVLAIAAGACNALNGSQDRVLADDAGGVDATDATSIVYVSENDAAVMTSGGAARITAFPPSLHTVVVPSPPLKIGSESYTVTGAFRITTDTEFGLFVRGQSDGSGYIVASQFGGGHRLSIGMIGPPNWNPTSISSSPSDAWSFMAPEQSMMIKVRVSSSDISGKIWDVQQPEPSDFEAAALTDFSSTGQIVGFYVYGSTTVVFENLQVTVP